jgi:CHASE2 domain-containing sensor protein
MRRRPALRAFARVLEWFSIAAGLVLVASCTTAGFATNHLFGGVAAFAIACVFAAVFVGVVFLLTTMSADVMELRSKADPGPSAERSARDQEQR